ncbi:hypothetical protein E1100_25885 [Vibrio owensii]|uniref:phage tail-collar fiber domain-containing protein n=1 Tax=Vibrio owensii TaxID=696485 RepID=UPI001042B4DB|nr:phage tail protein [Vibrio owensii]TDE19294.1 hypothetical protein E1100_25885 [Vibrio owensii]
MTQTPENQQQYGSILTILGENAEQNGKLQNKQITFTHMAIGDANDEYVQPDRKQSALVNELARIPVNSVDVLQPTPDSVPMLKVEAILPDDVNDLVIREFAAVATFDGNTYFHAVGNNARIYVPPPVNNGNVNTPVTLEMIFVITSAEPIVEIDPHVVTASREWVSVEMKKSSESDTGTSQIVGTLSSLKGKVLNGEDTLTITDINQKLVMVPFPPKGSVIKSIDLSLNRIDFEDNSDFSYLIKKSAIGAYIDAKAAGIKDGVDSAVLLEALQFASEYLRKPLDLSDVSDLQFTGKVLIDKWFHWKGKGRFKTKVTPLTRTRTELGADIKGQYQWFGMKDPTKSLEFALVEDIGFDGAWTYGPGVTLERLINTFRFVAVGKGTHHSDITAIRCNFSNPAHEAFEVQTWDGATADGVRMMFCSGDVDDPATSYYGANMFKCMNGQIENPGEYGVYTIKNIVSFGNICRGYRTLNDFKRGCEEWNISGCRTYEMNDCHHSTDGSRNGTFDASNTGVNTGEERVNKNFLEIQGENIDVMGFTYDITKSDKSDSAVAGLLVTDYAYPAENGDMVGNRGNQSVNVNVYSATVKGVSSNHAVRFVNTKDCSAFGIKAYDCGLDALTWETLPGKVDKEGNPIVPENNKCDNIEAIRCRHSINATEGNDVSIGSNVKKDNGNFGLANFYYDSASFIPIKLNFAAENLNPNPLVIDFQGGGDPLFWTTGSASDAEYSVNSTSPAGVPAAFSLEDKDITRVQYRALQSRIAMSEGDELYVSFFIRKETSNKAAVIFFEYDANGDFLRNSFSGIVLTSDWEKRVRKYVVTNSDTRFVSVALAPADFDNQPASVGKTGFSDIKISRMPII